MGPKKGRAKKSASASKKAKAASKSAPAKKPAGVSKRSAASGSRSGARQAGPPPRRSARVRGETAVPHELVQPRRERRRPARAEEREDEDREEQPNQDAAGADGAPGEQVQNQPEIPPAPIVPAASGNEGGQERDAHPPVEPPAPGPADGQGGAVVPEVPPVEDGNAVQGSAQDGQNAQVDDAENNHRDELSGLTTMAEIMNDRRFTYRDENAKFRVRLRVHQDFPDLKSRLGYSASLFVVTNLLAEVQEGTQPEAEDLPEIQAVETRVGYIHAWRIDKPTARVSGESRDAWIQKLLRYSPNGPNVDGNQKETAWCMQALYTREGEVRNEREVAELRNELQENSLIFIQMVYIFPEFQRQGLLAHALSGYHQALSELPEWFAFSGSLVLVPGKPKGSRAEGWENMDDREVEDTLIDAYQRRGRYELWVRDQLVRGRGITVMGRTI